MPGPGLIYKACVYPSSSQYKVRNGFIQSKNLQQKDNGHIKLEKPSNRKTG